MSDIKGRLGAYASVLRAGLTLAILATVSLAAAGALAADKVIFGTNWKAEGEHGGFYQALADGTYKKYGLDVEIRQGGPQINHSLLLASGAIDISMSANNSIGLNFLKNDIPMVTVAAFFQKDPQVLLSHPGQGNDTIKAMKGKPIMISGDSRETWWKFLKLRYGFSDTQIRSYTFQMAPFLVNKSAIQQGYVTSEPFAIQKAGVKPNVILIADQGWPSYSTMLTLSKKMVREKRDVVQRFVDASIDGWVTYLYGDPSAGNKLIKQQNPEMTDAQITYTIAKMKEYGIVDSGDTKKLGIGAMTEARLKQFFDIMVEAGAYPADMKHMDAFDLSFVNKKHGMK